MDRLGIDEHVIRLLNSQPCVRYLQRVMACTIWDRKEVGMMRTDKNVCHVVVGYDHLQMADFMYTDLSITFLCVVSIYGSMNFVEAHA